MSVTIFSDKVEIAKKYGGELENNQGSLSIDAEYDIIGTIDELTAYTRFSEYIFTNIPVNRGLRVETLGVEGNREGAPLFTGHVRYSSKANESELSLPVQSFSTKGNTVKKLHSYETVHVASLPGVTAPNFRGGIGVKETTLEGCDVTVPNYTTTYTRKGLPHFFVTDGYKQMLRMMTGTVNASPFDGMAPGECLFLGADAVQNITNENGIVKSAWDLTWEFKAAPNVGGLVVSEGFTPLDKRGWDYLWLYNIIEDDEESGRSIPRPIAAYVEQVYLYSNFMALGIF
jgi:hypothetical protein